MSQVQKNYNAKARQSTGGSRKKGKLKRKRNEGQPAQIEEDDPNATILIPKTKEQKDQERREKLRQELAAQSETKWNSKKKKRLEKYIDKKLKKEERVLIFERLAQTQAELPSSLPLQSSSSLGTGKVSTHQELMDRLEDKETRRAMEGHAGKRRRRTNAYEVTVPDDDNSQDADLSGDEILGAAFVTVGECADVSKGTVPSPASTAIESSAVGEVGSALQRNPDGTIVAPRIRQKIKHAKSTFRGWQRKGKELAAPEESDTSFDSSDSAYDSSGEGSEEDRRDENMSGISGASREEVEDEELLVPKKQLGFKNWALKQIDAVKGYNVPFDSNVAPTTALPSPPPAKKRKFDNGSQPAEMRGPLGEEIQLPATHFTQHLHNSDATVVKAVTVTRPPEVEEARILLPIVTEEQPIMEAVRLNSVVIICGETGSGKTTQVPQFLYEAGFGTPGSDNPGMIGITQPRRVAAISMATRVAHELSLTSSRVSYQIRYDATVSPATSVKFMTDGVLLRELATDFLLNKYSVIIIDEAHERSINTDILIGVLSRVSRLREEMWKEGKEGAKPLRLIIMSATLRVSDFAENRTLFSSPPPVIHIAARQHPVTIHFNRRTAPDYVTEAIKKISKIHTRLPPGGILVFLTGQNEITGVCRKLEAKFGRRALDEKRRRRGPSHNGLEKSSEFAETSNIDRNVFTAQADLEAEEVDLDAGRPDDLAFDIDEDMDEEDREALDSDGGPDVDEELGLDPDEVDVPMHVVPLYSLLPSEKQMHVFQPPPPGSRLVVVSTNIAETSLTIPGIRYVVDSGRAKERRYDVNNGVQTYQVSWISKASAAQRAGRAGRTGPGHCYRLYSSALFENHFQAFSRPEILRMPIEGVVLQMKSMHVDTVINFPFPTPPERSTIRQAEAILTHLGALSVPSGTAVVAPQITDLGKTMSLFPLSPRFSRMLVSGQQQGCLPYVVSIVSALCVGNPFLYDDEFRDEDEDSLRSDAGLAHLTSEAVKAKEARRSRRKAFFESQHTHAALGQFTSDVLKILSVVGAYEYAGGGHKFCSEHFVRPKAMEEIHKLRAQINNIVHTNFPGVDTGFVSNLRPPSALQLKVLRQLLTAAFIDQVAVRKDRVIQTSTTGVQFATSKGVPYKAIGIEEDVFLHPSSILANATPPEYVIFCDVVRTSRVWLKDLTVVNPAWLSTLGEPSLCTFSKPVKSAGGTMMMIPKFGPEGWELPPVKVQE